MQILILIIVFFMVAVAAFAIGSYLDQRSAKARLLRDRLNLARSEMESLDGLVASQLDVSMSRILGRPPAAS